MKPQTPANAADENAQYEQCRRPTKPDTFLGAMEQIGPLSALYAVIDPRYPRGRQWSSPGGPGAIAALPSMGACADARADPDAARGDPCAAATMTRIPPPEADAENSPSTVGQGGSCDSAHPMARPVSMRHPNVNSGDQTAPPARHSHRDALVIAIKKAHRMPTSGIRRAFFP